MRITPWLRRSVARRVVLAGVWLAMSVEPARADITAFLGVSPTPQLRMARGFSGGLSLLIVGFEFEYANLVEEATDALPSLKTWSGNVLLQTPVAIGGVTLYGTAGAGGYQEALGPLDEINAAINLGGGAKIRIAGPFRVRVDYRVFRLQGKPLYPTYQRLYVGANLRF